MSDESEKLEAASSAYASRDWDEALRWLNELADLDHVSPAVMGAIALRAIACEKGNAPQGEDLPSALKDFMRLTLHSSVVGSIGYEGAARVLAEQDFEGNVAQIRLLATKAVECDGSPRARMMLGYIALRVDGSPFRARRHYIAAAREGSRWGLLAAAETYRGRSLLGFVFLKAAALLLRPFLRVGSRCSPYY